MPSKASITTEARAMLALAIPVVADQIGLMSMNFIDTIMVGRLGGDALGAVGIGSAVFFFFGVLAMGTLSAVSPTVAHAFGAGDRDDIERTVGQAFWLTMALAAMLLVVLWNVGAVLAWMEQPPALIPLAEKFCRAISYGVPAHLLYTALRAFSVGLGKTRVTMMISIVATFVNAGLDYLLIYGKCGLPALGVAGAGYATSIVQWVMFALAIFYTVRSRDLREYRYLRRVFPPEPRRLLRLLRLGGPIGLAQCMEVGIFALTALLMGRLGTIPLAAHQIAINIASLTFMVPLGIATATTTRVGQAMGRRELERAALSGWVGMGLSGLVMSGAALVLLAFPRAIGAIYTDDAPVLAYAGGLVMIAGAFQLFDGIQVSAIGALRGLKDTAWPMGVNFVSYWIVGVPSGYFLAFHAGAGGHGLWWGLTIGLATAAVLHAIRFRRLTRESAIPSW